MTVSGFSDLPWFKSSYSSGSGDNCVMNAVLPNSSGRAVHDSKDPSKGAFVVSPQAWQAFATMAKSATV